MGSAVIVIEPPAIDDPASFRQAQEQLTVQQLVPEAAVETFRVAVLPRALFQKLRFVRTATSNVPLRSAGLTKNTAGTTLRNSLGPQTTTHLGDRTSSPLGAHQFGRAASFRISLSSACSATSFFKRAFSFSKDRSCLVISGAIPPYF